MLSTSFLLHLLAVGSLGFLNVYGAAFESDVSTNSSLTATSVLPSSTFITATSAIPSSTVAALSVSPSFNSGVSEAEVPADPISKYTVQFFTDNIMPDFRNKQNNNCVFYANGKLSDIAKNYARRNRKVSIWDPWLDIKCTYYKTDAKLPSNRLRDIMGDPAKKKTYFENMSEAFAKHCTGEVVVMTRASRADDIPQNGIWGQIEQKTLKKRNSGCTKIDAISSRGNIIGPVFDLFGSIPNKRDMDKRVFVAPPPVVLCPTSKELDDLDDELDW